MSATKPSLPGSMLRGTLGFGLLGIAGFLPWAMNWTLGHGEAGMYALCLLMFVTLSGPLLHGLLRGDSSPGRFYRVFWLAYGGYAAVWCVFWFAVPVLYRDYYGLALGCVVFAVACCRMLRGWRGFVPGVIALILLHGAGYWAGGAAYAHLRPLEALALPFGITFDRATCAVLARLAWGLFYGLGFGAGMGALFHFCQKPRDTY